MKLLPILTALSSVMAFSAFSASSVEAKNSFSANEQMILNNFGMQEQKLSDQINAYVSSGQLSPQQGANFQNQLNQMSDDAMYAASDPGQTTMMIGRFSSFANQITGSLGTPGQYQYVPTNPVYSLRPRNFYTNWQNRWQNSPRYNSWYNRAAVQSNAQFRLNQAAAQKQATADRIIRDAKMKQAAANFNRYDQVQENQRRAAEARYRAANRNDPRNDNRWDDHHGHHH